MIDALRQDLSLIANLVPQGASALDIGCGDGTLLRLLRDFRQVRGYGLEIDASKVSEAVAGGQSVVQGNADTDLPDYPDNAFDVVILSNSLQTLARPDLALTEAARVGRKVIVSFPNFGHWRVRLHLALHGTMPISKQLPDRWFDTPNIHLCTITDFLTLCQDQNLSVQDAFQLKQGASPRGFSPQSSKLPNLLAEAALFVLSRP